MERALLIAAAVAAGPTGCAGTGETPDDPTEQWVWLAPTLTWIGDVDHQGFGVRLAPVGAARLAVASTGRLGEDGGPVMGALTLLDPQVQAASTVESAPHTSSRCLEYLGNGLLGVCNPAGGVDLVELEDGSFSERGSIGPTDAIVTGDAERPLMAAHWNRLVGLSTLPTGDLDLGAETDDVTGAGAAYPDATGTGLVSLQGHGELTLGSLARSGDTWALAVDSGWPEGDSRPRTHWWPLPSGRPLPLLTGADTDGDGFEELLLRNGDDVQLVDVRRGEGVQPVAHYAPHGPYPPREVDASAPSFGPHLAVADFDADGHPDLAVMVRTPPDSEPPLPGAIALFLGPLEGQRPLAEADFLLSVTGGWETTFGGPLLAMDIDSDGVKELVVGSPDANGNGVARGRVDVLDDFLP